MLKRPEAELIHSLIISVVSVALVSEWELKVKPLEWKAAFRGNEANYSLVDFGFWTPLKDARVRRANL